MKYVPHKAYATCKQCGKQIEYWHDIVEVREVATGTMTTYTDPPHYHKNCLKNSVHMIDNKDGSTSIYI